MTTVSLGKLMILATNNSISALQFLHSETGELQLEVDNKRYAISNTQFFECHGNFCYLEIFNQTEEKISFSLSGKNKLTLVIQR